MPFYEMDNRLATIDMGRKVGLLPLSVEEAGFPRNTHNVAWAEA